MELVVPAKAFDNNDGLASGQCIGQAIHDRVSFKDDDDD